MKKLLGVFKYEYRMSIQRRGLWVAVLLFTAFYIFMWTDLSQEIEVDLRSRQALLSEAGQTVFFLNLFFPVVAGIAGADRAVRDRTLGVRELLRATSTSNFKYVLGKYLGVAFSLLTFGLFITLSVSTFLVVFNQWPLIFLPYTIWASLLILAPGLFFITAFSLACPLIMPVRVYQILFTGYWYWGNFLSPQVMFTVSETMLNASGRYALIAIFGMKVATNWQDVHVSTALLNILVLFTFAALALTGMWWILRTSEKG